MREESEVCNFAWKNSPSEKLEDLGEYKRIVAYKKKDDLRLPKHTRPGVVASHASPPAAKNSNRCARRLRPCPFLSSPARSQINVHAVLSVPCPATQVFFVFFFNPLLAFILPTHCTYFLPSGFHVFLLLPAKTAVFPKAMYLKEGLEDSSLCSRKGGLY